MLGAHEREKTFGNEVLLRELKIYMGATLAENVSEQAQ